MDLTCREAIGARLVAPSPVCGSLTTRIYALVPLMRPGAIVLHYDSR